MLLALSVLLVLVLVLGWTPSFASDLSGSVVRVLDDDAIEVLHINRPERIRFSDIDCPEKGQPYG